MEWFKKVLPGLGPGAQNQSRFAGVNGRQNNPPVCVTGGMLSDALVGVAVDHQFAVGVVDVGGHVERIVDGQDHVVGAAAA